MQAPSVNKAIRYEADERCPLPIALGVGLQGVIFAIAPIVLIVAITAQAGGQGERYLTWAVFATLIIAGALTALQASRIGRLGAGHVLIMGATPNFVAVSVLALTEGGAPLLASLVVVASLFYLALYARLMRATMLEQRGLDYVTTARAKGLTERQITFRHVLRNALLPVVTMAGVQVGALLGGSVVVEAVFAWPGLGQLAFEALFSRDFNLLLGIFFISACLVVFVNIVVDVIYVLLDPRIKVDE